MDWTELKRQAAERAVTFVQSGMVVGLGTGSTAVHAVRAIGRRLQAGELVDVLGIPTSEKTAADARAVGIPLTTFDTHPRIDITIDGADEVDRQLQVMKGLGGALLREKIVAVVSARLVIVADGSKRVTIMGTRAPVPVEVIPFARQPVSDYLQSLGAEVILRQMNGETFYTDERNIILDCHFRDGIVDPVALAGAIQRRPGVVEHGLFLDLATDAIIATAEGEILHWRR